MNKPQIIIGLGTGRCGTVSLSHLLNSQADSNFTHECQPRLPWEKNMKLFDEFVEIQNKKKESFVGDVSFYHLPYVEEFLKIKKDIKFVCLQRDKDDTVKSYLKKVGERNHWQNKGVIDPWDKHYPTFENNLSKKQCVEEYWEEYYSMAYAYNWCYSDNFRVYKTEELNEEKSVLNLLEFCGFDNPNVVTAIQKNKGIK